MIILGIETSCDDTGIAVIKADQRGLKRTCLPTKQESMRISILEQAPYGINFDILSNIVSSQVKVHAKYGGVVPNLAAREHLRNIEPCLKQAIKESKINLKKVDLIAVTTGPGLIPSLLIGVNFAKALAYKWQIPIIGVNHLEGHIAAIWLSPNHKTSKFRVPNPNFFPAISLLVSGGHTQLILINDFGKYKIIGETRDDAAGECFDKIAKLLNLGYPGGPAIATEAAKLKTKSQKLKVTLPRPMIEQKNYDFSFSGLKTAVLYLIRDNKEKIKDEKFVQNLCAEAQQAIIDVLIEKTMRAAKEYKAKTIILSGGVAANKELRKQLTKATKKLNSKPQLLIPHLKFCTDNAAMIAVAGYLRYKFKRPNNTNWRTINADANLRLKNW